MPLVRISVRNNYSSGKLKMIGDIVYQSMHETLDVPEHDHFQVLTRHDDDSLIFDKQYLGIKRSEGFVMIQITLNQGRSVELKKAFYRKVAQEMHEQLYIRPEDIFINLVEVPPENWSFGDGIAQYA